MHAAGERSLPTEDAQSCIQREKRCREMAFVCLLLWLAAAHAVPMRQGSGFSYYTSLSHGESQSMTLPPCININSRFCEYRADSPVNTVINMQCYINMAQGSMLRFYYEGNSQSNFVYWTDVTGYIDENTHSNAFFVTFQDFCFSSLQCMLYVLDAVNTTTTSGTTTTGTTTTSGTTTTGPTTTSGTTTTGPTTTPGNTTCECGVKNVARIVGGNEVDINEWPWHAGLRRTSDLVVFCGASLIHSRWLLTASHCLIYQPQSMDALLGDHNVNQNNETPYAITVGISDVFQHGEYDAITVDNDIGLVKLAADVTFNDGIRPICLPFSFVNNDFQGENGIVTGWGTTSYQGSASDVLLDVQLPILTTTECTAFYGSEITPNMICTYLPGFDACQGDSGGPLSWLSGGRYYLIGIVSWGKNCSEVNAPGVYAKVDNYIGWIQDRITGGLCQT
ncbi:trypsin-1-like [Penaeus japonicus]|uniref:trypsin-1-like n=1 Tax=Penaeus japonicus TaxID=27405 RepID=UPI001C714F94|nr:trypsin-1-like [Penaeus japonicus]